MGSDSQNSPSPPRPSRKLDDALQRELDEALGDMSLEDLIDADAAQKPPAATDSSGVRRGTVIAIQGDDIFVNMGSRSEGLLPAKQFEDEPLPEVGDTVEVTIKGYDSGEGLLLLSRRGAATEASWETLEEGQIVDARVTGHNKGGLEVTVNGIRAFMPVSQVELYHVDDLSDYVNKRLRCMVTEVNQSERNVILSRRAILEAEAAEAREKAFESLIEGQTVVGVVKTIMPYGAFVDIGGVDGLLHVREMSHARVEDPHTIVTEGQRIEVMVLRVDPEERRISLGLKQLLSDPWADAAEKWLVDSIVSGRVTRLADFGAFVELEDGVEGLVPIGEMTFERRIAHPREVANAGDVVTVRVMNVDIERKRISLSLKRAGEDPWTGASVRWPEGAAVDGIVMRVTDFGAFVELAPGVQGLLHVSELSDEHVRSVGEVVREGDRVRAKVLSVDEDSRRIALSIKQLAETPAAAASADEPRRTTTKRNRPLKGGLD